MGDIRNEVRLLVQEVLSGVDRGNKGVLLAFAGRMGAGKDYLAEIAKWYLESAGETVIHLAFADAIKLEIKSLFFNYNYFSPYSAESLAKDFSVEMDDAEKTLDLIERCKSDGSMSSGEKTQAMRELLQYWGTDVRRKSNKEYWCDACIESALSLISKGISVVISDARYENEYEGVKALGGMLIRVDVPDNVWRQRLLLRDGVIPDEALLEHSTELAWRNYKYFDKILVNG